MQEKDTVDQGNKTKIESELNYTCEPVDDDKSKRLRMRMDYKGRPICQGSKYHVSFKDQISSTQQLVTYINIQSYKDDYDVDSDVEVSGGGDSSGVNNSSNTKSVSSLSNNNMIMQNNKYFMNYKHCCCSVI